MGLLPEIDRYGEAIEYDLWDRGDNLLHYFSPLHPDKTWRRLRVILERLPRTSKYVTAKKNDPEVALEVARALRDAKNGPRGSRWHPPADEWDSANELLATAVDRLGEIEALLSALPVATGSNGKPIKRPKPPKQLPRPRTAIERAEALLAEEHVLDIIADVEASYVSAEDYAAEAARQEQYRRDAAAQ